jgi:Glycosyl hydrolase 36 superfamily, catalytic domain
MAMDNALFTRREILTTAGALVAGSVLPAWAAQDDSSLGEWLDDDFGLPCYRYTGPLRFPASPKENGTAMLPDDPLFLLGNYRLTLFAHASGIYQIFTSERAWGRVNQGDTRYSGANRATVKAGEQIYELIGIDQPAAIAASKRFGVGFAQYDYNFSPLLRVTRLISVTPSTAPNEGTSAFLVQVRIRNNGTQPIELQYSESTRARYQQVFAPWDQAQKEIAWPADTPTTLNGKTAFVSFRPRTKRKMAFPPQGQMCLLEQFPPALFVHSMAGDAFVDQDPKGDSWTGVRWAGTLNPNEERELSFITGYTRDMSLQAIHNVVASLRLNTIEFPRTATSGSMFGESWRRIVPSFGHEPDAVMRRELQWNVAMLEAMATWREYYNETVIPQGTVYDYTWGNMASSRDLAQHALPLCHTNPKVARSVLRFLMKRTVPDGEIKLNDEGFGWSPSGAQQTSDQQLFFFLLLAEYLRVTDDTSVLHDQIEYYPRDCSGRDTGLAHIRQAFLFLRDRIGVGPHGIVRRWNSDWNDMFFFWPTTMPYNRMFEEGESHMNSAMAIVILGDLADAIDARDHAASELTAAMREYRSQLLASWMTDLGDRAFPRRAWTSYSSALGDKEMWLEPQGFALQIPEFSADRKRRLFEEITQRLLQGETMGARQIETPVQQPGTPGGSRENGGFWYALNGPLILGVAKFDKSAASALLQHMTFANFAKSFPDYWTGRWSASDSLDSSILKTNGLSENMIYCAHAHAWPLYCWLRLHEEKTTA